MAKSARSPRGRLDVRSRPPEGGWGIVVVLAVHLNMALGIGLLRCTGVFFRSWSDEFSTGASETAAVQSIMSSASCFNGITGGILVKRFGCRFAGMLGGTLMSLGLFCSHWVGSITQMYVAAAVAGSGVGISYNAGLVAVAMYFKRRYKTANAVAFSGFGLGITAVPPLIQLLLNSYGWRGAVLITSAILANVVAFSALFRPLQDVFKVSEPEQNQCHQVLIGDKGDGFSAGRDNSLNADGDCATVDSETCSEGYCSADYAENQGRGEKIHRVSVCEPEVGKHRSAPRKTDHRGKTQVFDRLGKLSSVLGLNVLLRSYRFSLVCFLQIEFCLPFLAFVQFIVPRAQSIGVALSNAAFLLSALGIGSFVGLLGNAVLISWRLSAEIALAACVALSGVSLLILNLDSYVCLAIVSFLQGSGSSVFYAVSVVLTRRFVGLENFAVSAGLFDFFAGVGTLIGPIIAGWLLDVTGSYKTLFYVIAGIYIVCALQMLLFPLLRRIEPGIDVAQ